MNRLDNAYFDRVYEKGTDPWGFDTRWYERRKYALTMAALPHSRYRRAFEPGCANGALTKLLAPRCESLIALELVPKIAKLAQSRVPDAEVRVGALPEAWPTGSFDLVVASEVLYYLRPDGFAEMLARLEESLEPGGHLVAVHWRLETDYPLTGDEVHRRLAAARFLTRLSGYEEREFRLDVFERKS